jgi:hypothetical protein
VSSEQAQAIREAIEAEITRRRELSRAAALHAVTVDPPAYIRTVLGPRPEQPSRRAIWSHAARRLEDHRLSTTTPSDQLALEILLLPPAEEPIRRTMRHARRQLGLEPNNPPEPVVIEPPSR